MEAEGYEPRTLWWRGRIRSKVPNMFGFLSEARAIRGRVQALVQLNVELAKVEAKQKATSLGVAGGLAVGAAVLLIYGIGFAFATAAAGLSEAVPHSRYRPWP